ncbi:hypothetical protein IT774_05145 [Salinimonas marina]|uniref:Uncharacterized protein n=1 Tax=Salinimonas marina TaxID=2785918 RepID=A0A7S9HDU2_9ALTE|nr:phage tail tube protein [Salinimonas marina]QPG06560.1 hypothetical protein IT774_05145 [Salinimonas marina]
MSRLTRKKLLAAAINTGAYGVDAIAAGTALYMRTKGLTITPIEGEDLDRELDTPDLGNSKRLLVGNRVKVTASVEWTAAGIAANKPAYDPVLVAGGWNATASAGGAIYSKITDNSEKDVTFYVYKDGALHKITGARATTSFKAEVNQIPTIETEITGLYGGIVSSAMPSSPDFSGFQEPLKVGSTYTTFKIGNTEYKMLSLEMSDNVAVSYDENTKEERVYITDFTPEGKVVIEAPSLGELDPFTQALNHTDLAITLTHGTTAGKILELKLPKIQLKRPAYDSKDGRDTYSLEFWVIGSDYTMATK